MSELISRQQGEPYHQEPHQLFRLKRDKRCDTCLAKRKIVLERVNDVRHRYLVCPFGHREEFIYDEQRDI